MAIRQIQNGYNGGWTSGTLYTDYWRQFHPQGGVSAQAKPTTSSSSIVQVNKWKVIVIVSTVLATVTLGLSVFNVISTGTAKSPSETATSSSQPASSPSPSPTSSTEIVTSESQTTTSSSRSTTNPSELAIMSSQAETSLNLETTTAKGIDRSSFLPFLPYGKLTGDEESAEMNLAVTSNADSQVFGITLSSPITINVGYSNAAVNLPEDIRIFLCFSCFAEPDPSKDEHFYYRRVNSADDMSDISCWLNNVNIVDAFVFSWINLKYKESDFKPFKLQCILVFAENEQTYAIRIFDEDLPSDKYIFIVKLDDYYGLADMKTASGKRIIHNITTKYEELKDKQNC